MLFDRNIFNINVKFYIACNWFIVEADLITKINNRSERYIVAFDINTGKNKFILPCLSIQIGWRDEFIR